MSEMNENEWKLVKMSENEWKIRNKWINNEWIKYNYD